MDMSRKISCLAPMIVENEIKPRQLMKNMYTYMEKILEVQCG